MTFWTGQLAALILLVLLAGLCLHRRNHPTAAGCLLSLLALKPQLAVGLVLWWLLRRDVRALAGFCLGLLVQLGLVAALLGPDVLLAYARNTACYGQFHQLFHFTADLQHALAGILSERFGPEYRSVALSAHAVVVLLAGFFLWRIGCSRPQDEGRSESAAAVLFLLLATPHLLTYDLCYLLLPIVWLLHSSRKGDGSASLPAVVLYLCATLAPLYLWIGFSLVPAVLLGVLFALSRTVAARTAEFLREPDFQQQRGATPHPDSSSAGALPLPKAGLPHSLWPSGRG
jgi:hypothetical protein